MRTLTAEDWACRYRLALQPGEVRRRAEVHGVRVMNLPVEEVEAACRRLSDALESINLVSDQAESIIRMLIELALAHAVCSYADPLDALRAQYGTAELGEPIMPILLTGLAGVGKSRIRKSIQTILSGRSTISVDRAHPALPLVDYQNCVIGQQASVPAVLRTLANPEIASGRVKTAQGDIAAYGARWQRASGTCLLGVDEVQFMAQSSSAATLITKTLLGLTDVRVPWFFIANYSLCRKLLNRPSEAMQRLLGHPRVLFPDAPDSKDWLAFLAEYQVVMEEVLDFVLCSLAVDLWNMTGGIKRELRKLLLHAYRCARAAGRQKISWSHILQAFGSTEFSVARRDIQLLAAHAGQGGKLRSDLDCPFTGHDIRAQVDSYGQALRAARQSAVANATVQAAMTAQERAAIGAIEQVAEAKNAEDRHSAKPARRKRAGPKTVSAMTEAAMSMRSSLGREPVS